MMVEVVDQGWAQGNKEEKDSVFSSLNKQYLEMSVSVYTCMCMYVYVCVNHINVYVALPSDDSWEYSTNCSFFS